MALWKLGEELHQAPCYHSAGASPCRYFMRTSDNCLVASNDITEQRQLSMARKGRVHLLVAWLVAALVRQSPPGTDGSTSSARVQQASLVDYPVTRASWHRKRCPADEAA